MNEDGKFIVIVDPFDRTVDDTFATKRKTYPTEEAAMNAAKALNERYPTKRYYVAELVGYAHSVRASYTSIR